jgi:hypothetical protein
LPRKLPTKRHRPAPSGASSCETAAGNCGGFSLAKTKGIKLKMARSASAKHATKQSINKKAGTNRPFVIRPHISASTSVVKGKADTAARLIAKG